MLILVSKTFVIEKHIKNYFCYNEFKGCLYKNVRNQIERLLIFLKILKSEHDTIGDNF